MSNKYKYPLLCLCTGIGLMLTGCQTYQAKSDAMQASFKSGDLAASIKAAESQYNKNRDGKDAVVTALELAEMQRVAALAELPVPVEPAKKVDPAAPAAPAEPVLTPKQYWTEKSLALFSVARDRIVKYEEEAKASLTSQTGALFTNLDNLPYKGKEQDVIMLSTYASLTHLFQEQPDQARVELNRVLQAQRNAVEMNSKRIQATKDAADAEAAKAAKSEKPADGSVVAESAAPAPAEAAPAPADAAAKPAANSGGYDTNRALKDPKLAGSVSAAEQELNALTSDAYANYVNPFSVMLDGLFHVTHADGASDLERARKSFERVAGMVPNSYLKADLEMANEAANGKLPENLTYVIFETGTAPHFEELRVDIPLFIIGSGRVPYAGAALPRLRVNNEYVSSLSVSADSQSFKTELLCDMDAVVAQSFKNEWPTILTKTLISTGVKATTSYFVNKAVEDRAGAGWGLVSKLVTGLTNYATTIADTRCWTSLPKQFQYCRFVTPASRSITLTTPGANGVDTTSTVALPEGKVVLVYVKSISPRQPNYIGKVTLLQ